MHHRVARFRRTAVIQRPRRPTAASLNQLPNMRDVSYAGSWGLALLHRSVADANHFRANDVSTPQPMAASSGFQDLLRTLPRWKNFERRNTHVLQARSKNRLGTEPSVH